jgi:hypothetical protein
MSHHQIVYKFRPCEHEMLLDDGWLTESKHVATSDATLNQLCLKYILNTVQHNSLLDWLQYYFKATCLDSTYCAIFRPMQ